VVEILGDTVTFDAASVAICITYGRTSEERKCVNETTRMMIVNPIRKSIAKAYRRQTKKN